MTGAPSAIDDRRLPDHRQHDLDRVEAQSRRDVESGVGMVHPVNAPEQRNLVAGDVFQPDGEIEEDEARGCRATSDARRAHGNRPQPFSLGRTRRANRGRRKDDPQNNRRQHDHRQVGEPALCLQRAGHLGALKPWRPQFEDRHRREDGQKGAEPDCRFGELHGASHWREMHPPDSCRAGASRTSHVRVRAAGSAPAPRVRWRRHEIVEVQSVAQHLQETKFLLLGMLWPTAISTATA